VSNGCTPAGSGTQSDSGATELGDGGDSAIADSPESRFLFDPTEALPCFIDAGTPADGKIEISLEPSRTSGVAPLAVFLDTIGTVADSTSAPFHDLGYCWNFGDPRSGAFPTTGLSRNEAMGPVASHVFEEPGEYAVQVSVRDANGRVASKGVLITVEDPEVVFAGASTVCFSVAGDFTGCPDGGRHVTISDTSQMQPYVETGARLLLRRGETFHGSSVKINVPGPGVVGAFGPDGSARPKVTTSEALFQFSGPTPNVRDWRIVDIQVVGDGDESEFVVIGGKASDVLVFRSRATRVGLGVSAPLTLIDYWNANGSPGHDVVDVLAIQDCEFRDVVGGSGHNLVFAAAHRLILVGNTLQNSTSGEHVVRSPWIDRGVISNNDFAEAPAPRHLLKIHAPGFGEEGVGKGRFTERVVVSENTFSCTGGHDWSVAIGPQNESSDERVRDVLVEGNLFLPGQAQIPLVLWGRAVTVRNNLFYRSDQARCVTVGRRGVEPSPLGVNLVHNTCVGDEAPVFVSVGESATDIFAFNNLVVGRGVSGLSGDLLQASGNLLLEGVDDSVPTGRFDIVAPTREAAIDAADGAHTTFWDMARAPRPVDGDGTGTSEADVGALEFSLPIQGQ
jgi:hypothetical protein